MNRFIKSGVGLSALALVAIGMNGGNAAAAPCSGTPQTTNCTTSVTLLVNPGQLTITGAGTIALSAVSITGDAQSTTGTGTTTEVRDNRGAGAAPWTASATATDFDNAGNLIPATGLDYNANNSTSSTGPGTFAFLSPTDISTVKSIATHSSVVGNNKASWAPILTLAIPASGLVTGTYTSTMTTSVA